MATTGDDLMDMAHECGKLNVKIERLEGLLKTEEMMCDEWEKVAQDVGRERDEARADALYATENWQRCVKERDRALSVVARLRAELGQEPLTEGHEPDCKCTECGQAWLEANLEPSPTLKGER